VVLALAAAARGGFATPQRELLQVARRYYRHRFRYKRDFGQAAWWAQASAAWYVITSDREWAAFVLEIGHSLLPNQSNRSGGFLSDSPGDSTIVFLEAVGAAIRTAEAVGDLQAWIKAVADEPLRQGALGLIAAVTLLMVVCTYLGEKRWRAAGMDVDGDHPPTD
jgi:hypothetical protein